MIPTDNDILNAVREGYKCAPDIVQRLYGIDGTGDTYEYYQNRRSKVNARLRQFAKHGLVRLIGEEKRGKTYVMMWEAIE